MALFGVTLRLRTGDLIIGTTAAAEVLPLPAVHGAHIFDAMARAEIGMVLDYRAFPASATGECARRCEAAGIEGLLVVEDCFQTASASLAGVALAVTESLQVTIGVMSAVAGILRSPRWK